MALPRIQDDLYMAVNGAWQEKTQIPPDKSVVSADSDLSDDIRTKLVADLRRMALTDGDTVSPLRYAARLFAKADDKTKRQQLGIDPVRTRVQTLVKLTTLDQFRAAMPTLIAGQYVLPVTPYVDADMHDAEHNILNLGGPDTILPDAAMYRNNDAENTADLAAWSKMATAILAAAGFSESDQKNYVEAAKRFDRRLAEVVPDNVDLAVDSTFDNPMTWQAFEEAAGFLGIPQVFADLMPQTPTKVNAVVPNYVSNLPTLITADNYPEWHAWMVINELLSCATYLSDDLRQLAGQYDRFLAGQPEASSWTKHAFGIANEYFDDVIGQYYGQTYFGADAKADITAIVEQILAQYRVQLENNTWLSSTTKQKAIRKLATMKVKMGYPDQLFSLYDHLTVDADDDLLTAVLKLSSQAQQFWFKQVGQPVDRNEWNMPGHLVNASYDPLKNDITFPAGILQPPYYELNWTKAQNLGGTGVTIGHEISHSFDNNGALYDEHGNLHNWWTPADKQAFDQLVKAMATQFDGRTYEGVKVNGTLTVSENMADNAGMDVALALLGDHPDVKDLQAFFTTYARSWATKMRPERVKTLLRQDVHAPAALRVNVPVQNFPAWYQAFQVQPQDGMYRQPQKRLTIWHR
ncbi:MULTISPECIES: M13-type metalloendopeptidase [Lacticaseibacillus]|uniref:M13-type metalloendopeptidase n=1 Tax=Lacticaseibacillus TaxID=2759736 RepID=UPI00063DA150|nr:MULTISPECIES: M13 family metallopeptidase [Lacticaseibacillus]KLI76174.1 endopeptidase [Lacticaseibacillus casei]